ncbi:MAG: RNA polymerase sigma factor [Lachnospiraceae bacterium]|nr:RNA polymerase sigma factor [Lachnospiraceae bacterium]
MNRKKKKDEFIEKVFAEMYDDLKAFAFYKSRDKRLVEDILQETYLEAYRHADELMEHENYKGWMYVTAMNKIMKLNKESMSYNECLCFEEQMDAVVEPEYDFVALSEIQSLVKAEDFKLITLHYLDKYTYDEIAKMCDKKTSYVKMRIFRALRQLKDKIDIQ